MLVINYVYQVGGEQVYSCEAPNIALGGVRKTKKNITFIASKYISDTYLHCNHHVLLHAIL